MTHITQRQRVLRVLKGGSKLSSRYAAIQMGIMDMPKRISELRQLGHNIHGERIQQGRLHWNVYSYISGPGRK